jgi:C-terminal processing protease CtpA/Prc
MIASWSPASPAELEPLYEVLSDFADAKRLVIDVRPNGGGDELAARDFAGCFVSKPAVYSKNDYRDDSKPDGFGPPLERVVEPKKGRPAFRGKVAVLMGPANVSSCESFLLMMRHGAGARLFGERSGGASGNPKPHDLGNGVTVLLPSWRDMLPDGTLLEGKGIEPDQTVKGSPADFARGDPVLDAALKWLRS